jgi:hypothetical protein
MRAHSVVFAVDALDARKRIAWARHERNLVRVGFDDRPPSVHGVDLPSIVLATTLSIADVAPIVRACSDNVVFFTEFVVAFCWILVANAARVSDGHAWAVAKSDVHQREGTLLCPFIAVMNKVTAKQASDQLAGKVRQLVSLI